MLHLGRLPALLADGLCWKGLSRSNSTLFANYGCKKVYDMGPRGESKYQEREEDIRVLKLEVKRLRHDETLLVK